MREEILQLLEAGAVEEAGERLLEIQESHGDDVETWMLTATFFLMQGNTEAAEEALRVALDRDADRFDVRFLVAQLREEQGRLGEAEDWYASAGEVAGEAAPFVEEALQRLRAQRPERLAVFVRQGLDQFVGDLVERLGETFEVRKVVVTDLAQIEPAMAWADVCWFEWCDALVEHGARLELARSRRIVCRLHRYEAFTPVPARVAWENVDHLVVVAGHMRTIVEATVPGIAARVPITVVKNGVELGRYALRERRGGYRLAYVGYLHARKNPVLLLQVMAKLVKKDRRYTLHVAGEFQEPLLQLYWNHQVHALGLEDHVFFEGWQDDVPAWLADKDYFLSASIHESFGYAIAEAMAMGIRAVVHNFLFASDVWPQEILFDTVDEAVAQVTDGGYASAAYRRFIEAHYSLEAQVEAFRRVLQAPRPEAPPPLFRPGALKEMVEAVV